MAASCSVSLIASLTGLGQIQDFFKKMSVTTDPTAATYNYRVQATADTAEALDLGDISTVEYIIIYCVSNDLGVDCDYVSSFDEDIVVQEGEFACFKPSGTVYVKNNDSGETSTYEYLCIGTT